MNIVKSLISKTFILHSLLALGMVEAVAGSDNIGLATAKNQTIVAGGTTFSYRSFGHQQGTPLVFLQHFTGIMDYWDPAVVDGLAKTRRVIVFNNTGMGHSSGKVADSIDQMSKDAYAFITALGYKQVDLLGFSMGGIYCTRTGGRPSRPDQKSGLGRHLK